jgi:ectoine hydroxylase-related dioxygenase (phytanoyl-CoA dioxygenase family)
MNIQASFPDAAREIDTPYDITPEQIAQFEQQGFIKLSNVLSPQTIAYFKDALDPLMHHRAQELPPLAERDIYGQAFVAYDNLWLRDKTGKIKQLVFSRRLSMIAAALLRAQGVGLWHDQGLYKPPGGIGTPEHRDWFYWPMKAGKAATIWVALNDIPAERGSLKMRVGSNHIKLKHEDDCEISTQSDQYFGRHRRFKDLPVVKLDYKMGDVSIHDALVLHSTDPNETDRTREAFAVIYYNTDETLAPSRRENHEGMFNTLTKTYKKKVGDCLISPHTPQVYPSPTF